MHCHLQSHLVGILWFVPEQQCSPHEAVHDFMLKCSFNVMVQELSAVMLSLFQQRIGRAVCAAPLSDFGISVGKQKCSLLAEQAVQNHFCSSPKLELFLLLKSHVIILSFCAVGETLQGIIAGICSLLCQPGLLSILLCQELCGDSSRATGGHVTILVTHNLITLPVCWCVPGGQKGLLLFFLS